MIDFAAARTKMVDSQLRTEDVTDYGILAAMGDAPRERFVPAKFRELAYIDEDIAIREPASDRPGRYLMRPAPFARLLQLARIGPSDSVLDVGSGTGYGAAVLARLARSVVALESDMDLARQASETLADLGIANVTVVTGPLNAGYPGKGPYDVIFVGGAVEVVPPAFFDQLREGGRLVAIVGDGRSSPAMVYTRTGNDVGGRTAFNAYGHSLPGFAQPKVFVF